MKFRRLEKKINKLNDYQQALARGGQSLDNASEGALGYSPREIRRMDRFQNKINRIGGGSYGSRVGGDVSQTISDVASGAVPSYEGRTGGRRMILASQYNSQNPQPEAPINTQTQPTTTGVVDDGFTLDIPQLDMSGDFSGGMSTGTESGLMLDQKYGSGIGDGLMTTQQELAQGATAILGREVNNINDLTALRNDILVAQNQIQRGDDTSVMDAVSKVLDFPVNMLEPGARRALQKETANGFQGTLNYVNAMIQNEMELQKMALQNQYDQQGELPTTLESLQPDDQMMALMEASGIGFDYLKENPYTRSMLLSSGKPALTATQQGEFSEIINIATQMGTLQNAVSNIKKTGPISGVFKKMDPYNINAAALEAAKTGALPSIARKIFGEVGVLTDTDMERYGQLLPQITRPDNVNDVLLLLMYANLKGAMQTKIKTFGGRDTASMSPAVGEFMKKIDELEAKLNVPEEYRQPESRNQSQQPATQSQQFTPQQIQEVLDSGLYTMEQIQQFIGGSSFSNESQTSLNGNDITALSSRFESTGDPGAIGNDSGGGYSFGTYQLAHNNVIDFINSAGLAQYFPNQNKNSASFQQTWKALAKNNPQKFAQLQKDYIIKTHYEPQVQKLAQYGINASSLPLSVQQAIFSTAVQHGPQSDIIVKAYQGAGSPQEFLRNIYQERINRVARGSLTPREKQSVLNRFQQEYRLAAQGLSSNLA